MTGQGSGLPPTETWPLDQATAWPPGADPARARRFLRQSRFPGVLLEVMPDRRFRVVEASEFARATPVAVGAGNGARPTATPPIRPPSPPPRADEVTGERPAPPPSGSPRPTPWPPPAPTPVIGASPPTAPPKGERSAAEESAATAGTEEPSVVLEAPRRRGRSSGEGRAPVLRLRPQNWTLGQLLGKGVVYLVLGIIGLFALSGFVNLLQLRIHPGRPQDVTVVKQETIRENFPREVAAGTAVEFATFYLTPTTNEQERSSELNSISPPPQGTEWPQVPPPTSGTQGVEAVVPAAISASSGTRGVVTVAATLTPSMQTVFVAVPIEIQGNAAPVVTAVPTFVSPPRRGRPASSGSEWQQNSGLDSSAASAMKALFSAYGAGNSTLLQQMSVSGTNLGGGLGGAVQLQSVGSVETRQGESCQNACTVAVPVTWTTTDQVQWVQTYLVAIVREGDVWKVKSVSPDLGQ